MYAKMVDTLSFPIIKQFVWKMLGELRIFLTIFLVSFLGMVVFTNADMFWEKIFAEEVQVHKVVEHNVVKVNSLVPAMMDEEQSPSEDRVESVMHSMEDYQKHNYILENKQFDDVEDYLKESRKDQVFDFNILPPTDRIVIPSVGLDVPVIDSKVNNILTFTSEDFDDDLMSGVVKYPTTPVPGTNGNTLLFGHTSQERWKNNDYSTVFNKLPEIKP